MKLCQYTLQGGGQEHIINIWPLLGSRAVLQLERPHIVFHVVLVWKSGYFTDRDETHPNGAPVKESGCFTDKKARHRLSYGLFTDGEVSYRLSYGPGLEVRLLYRQR